MNEKGDPDLVQLGSRLQEVRKRALENTQECSVPEEQEENVRVIREEKERVPKFIVVSSPSDKNAPTKEYIVEEKIVEIHETVHVKKIKRNIGKRQKTNAVPNIPTKDASKMNVNKEETKMEIKSIPPIETIEQTTGNFSTDSVKQMTSKGISTESMEQTDEGSLTDLVEKIEPNIISPEDMDQINGSFSKKSVEQMIPEGISTASIEQTSEGLSSNIVEKMEPKIISTEDLEQIPKSFIIDSVEKIEPENISVEPIELTTRESSTNIVKKIESENISIEAGEDSLTESVERPVGFFTEIIEHKITEDSSAETNDQQTLENNSKNFVQQRSPNSLTDKIIDITYSEEPTSDTLEQIKQKSYTGEIQTVPVVSTEIVGQTANIDPMRETIEQASPETETNQMVKNSSIEQLPTEELMEISQEGENISSIEQEKEIQIQRDILLSESYSLFQDEREDVQKKTFAKWINSQLTKKNHPPITDLFYDLRDGTRLLTVLEILTDKKYKREKGRMRVHHLNNVGRALKILEEQNVKLVNISNDHIVDGSPKITLGLVWSIILHWQVQGVLKEVMSELQQTNLEKTLLAWCRQTTQGYQGVDVRNFTTSWRDGLAFCAIIHRHRPEFFEWPVMAKKHPYARLDNSFRIAQENLGIERLLDPEDVNTQNPDKKSIMMYVMCLFQSLPHSSISMDSLNVSVQSDSSFSLETSDISTKERSISVGSVGIGTYQQTLEEVLTWLLGAEDRLAGMPQIADNTKVVKDQFHELEDLMLELTSRQGGIGEVLSEGSRLLREQQLGEEESEEIRVQMKLLNTRWEELRVKAMDRQTKLHEQLMKLQQEELDLLKQWLTKTEDRIANTCQLGPTLKDLEDQIAAHHSLQEDLEVEQENINSLSNMVVVVDESSSDAAYSSLEDELNALGERWAHICKWAEQRSTVLQNVKAQWFEFDRDLQRFQQWLIEKEKFLKELESNPTNEKQEMLQQAASLQMLQAELESETQRQNALHELSSSVLSFLPEDSPAQENIPSILEGMQDRWECLLSILEAQKQRFLADGIDIDKLVPHVTTESTYVTADDGSIVKKVTTKTVFTETVVGLTSKRQKMTGESQEEFTNAVVSFGSYMDEIEKRLQPSVTYSLSSQEMEKICKEVDGELKIHEEEYKKVLSLGHSATSETATIGESTVENEIKLTAIRSRWAALEKATKNLRLRITFNENIKSINLKLEDMQREYSTLGEWINNTQSTTDFDSNVVEKQIIECQDKKENAKNREEDLVKMEKDVQNLPSLWLEEKDEVSRNVQALLFDFRNLYMRISNWEFILNEKSKSFELLEAVSVEEMMEVSDSQPDKFESQFIEGLEELTCWLVKVEEELDACPAMAPLPKMQDGLTKFKILLQEVDNESAKLSSINKSLEDSKSSLAEKVQNLNERWDRIVEALTNKVADIEKFLEMQRHFEEETSGLRSWLGEVEAFLEAEEAAVGDIETLQAQLEQSNALQDDIETLKNNVVSIGITAQHFQTSGDVELRENVKSQLEILMNRWENAVTKAAEQNASLKEALTKSQKVWKEGDEFVIWLEIIESKVPVLNSIETTSELNSGLSMLKEIREELESKKRNYDDLNNLGKEMMSVEKIQQCAELTQMFEDLNERWENFIIEVNSRYEVLEKCRENYDNFKKLCGEEGKWLDLLEEKLEKSNLKSTDAEEISEALYDLDEYLRSHSDALDKAQKIGEELTSCGVMSVAVQNSIHNLSSRFDNLTSKAHDQQQQLEGGVEEAQDLEREYVRVLDNLSSSQMLLDQMPKEIQLSEIKKQLVAHQEVLQKMEQRVEVYRTQGKVQAAQRLQDQLTHLVKQYEEVEEKVKLIQQSKDFDLKLVTISQQLTEIDERSREFDIKSVESEHLESQLNRCMEIYRSLSMVKSDVESVIATGRKIVKEGMTPDPETLTLQLDQLKALYNQLGSSVTEQRGRLELGVKQRKKIEKDSSQLEDWMTVTEKELDLREATLPVKNIQHELDFAQHAFDDVIRKKPVLANIKETLASLVNLFGGELTVHLQERVHDQTIIWERVQKRLTNRISSLKGEHGSKEQEIEKFIMKIGEIQAWLEKTENTLGKFDDLSTSEKEIVLQTVVSEIQEYKTKLEETKESSDDFVSHGTLFEYRLEPELSGIKRRLEHISSFIKVNESDLTKRKDPESFEKPREYVDVEKTSLQKSITEDVFGDAKSYRNFDFPIKSTTFKDHEDYKVKNSTVSSVKYERSNENIIESPNTTSVSSEAESLALQITQLKNSITELDKIPKPFEHSTEKVIESSRTFDTGKLGLVEIEEIKTTVSHLSYQIPKSPTSDSSAQTIHEGLVFSPQPKKPRRKSIEKKRYVESETEPENLDDVIAGLKEVAEQDDSILIEKARRKSQSKDDSKFGKDTMSIFKPSKREDDDLESLTSVDTDMAPMSETSRDLECTYSDLESISESVSSKGDPLLISTRDQLVTTSARLESFKFDEQFSSTLLFDFYPKEFDKTIKSSTESSKITSSAETLPVEKLQAMIAELDDVLSSDDTDSYDDSDVNSDINKLEMENSQGRTEFVSNTSDNTNNQYPSNQNPFPNPIEVKYQAIHVEGDIEFAKANASIQEGYEQSLKSTQKAVVSTPEIEESAVVKASSYNPDFRHRSSEDFETRRVAIHSAQTSEVVRGVTMQLSRTQIAASPEKATLVTIESYPGSVESLVSESKNREHTAHGINKQKEFYFYNPSTKNIDHYENKNDNWIKTVEDRVLEICPERKDSSKEDISSSKEENIEIYLNKVSVMVDRISVLRDRGDSFPKYTEAQIYAEEFEQGVCQLEPDVATLISKGDTLTLKTHMFDVPKANAIRLAVNNLRKSWTDLKERGEILKKESEQVHSQVREAPMKAKTLIHWLEEVSKKLDMANNVEKQIKILENEIGEKKMEIETLNSVGELLKRYKYEELQPMLTLINIRWSEINVHLSRYQKVGLNQKSIGEKTETELKDPMAIIPDFLASVNRIRESISSVSRQMNSKSFKGSKYENLGGREEELKGIIKELERLKPKVDYVETERLSTLKNASQSQIDQVRRVIDKLREEWAQVNRGYTDRYERWVHSKENLRGLHKTIDDFSAWLTAIEEKARLTAHQTKLEAKTSQKELEKQVTLKHRLSQTLQTLTKEVIEELPSDESKRLQARVDDLLKRWKSLLLELASRRERIASEDMAVEGGNETMDSIIAWIDQGYFLIDSQINVTDETVVAAHTSAVQIHLSQMESKIKSFQHLKNSDASSTNPLQLRTIETNLMKIAKCLPEYKEKLETKYKVVRTLIVDADDLYKWIEEQMVIIALRDLSPEELKRHRELLREKGEMYETLDNTYWALSQDAESKGFPVSETLKSRMNSIEARLKTLETQFSTAELLTTLNQRTTDPTYVTSSTHLYGSVETTAAASLSTTTMVTTSVTNVIQNAEIGVKEVDEVPPAPFPKTSEISSPALILAALDKSILQIRDWLTLMQQMSKQQTAMVGDSDNIRKLIEKQKSVLRELESKKPQLDELVASADSLKDDEARTQLHQQVSKLREHWDETNSSVLARKTQLDAMLNDTHKFESKRVELETWLSRMEARLERMHPTARAPDLLDQQIREQKSFHAEVHQYKHHIDLFTQMIGRLSTIYQNDDTRRLKNASETLNQRFNNLNSNIISRGKTLYAAMNSTNNMSKALEKFISWLSEAEGSVGNIEMEADKLPPLSGTGRRDSAVTRATYLHLKDLQSEIESHKDVLASLNATGQKLLGTLENQDEALLLHRRLGEMNHRWNTLKYKSIAIRNRLEGTAENWNSLLLSLRELIEWVIRKDTELSGLGPVVGDLHLLGKYENDLTLFRRGLDEKQPVIESNLKSGRQLIASEPPLSDTSDSEAGRELDGDARYRGEESTRDLTRSVRREVTKLSEKWAALWERAANLAAQVSLANKKLGVLVKTVEEVGSRLEESEKVVSTWGSFPQDQNLADQYVHNVRKFRETLPDLQRGVDDVNDQAARFSAHNVPLSPANAAALHDLNSRWKNLETTVNDRWRQIAGRSREVTPLTPAQLASSVTPPWERATATNKVPYYINHAQETTHWDHPQMMDLLDSLSEFNHIKFSAYRTATKLRSLQKKLSLDRAKLQMVTDVFDEHGLRGQNDRLIDVNDMIVVLSTLYGRISSDHNDVNTTIATDLCLNWLLNVYDSQRTGQMRVLSFRVGLICLCRGHLEEKYRYMFRLIADPNRLVDQRKLGLLLHDCVQVPRQLGEVAAFGGSNIEPSVRSCFTKAGKDREAIEAVHFLTWVQQEPQSLVWLAVLHRVAASESIQHQVKCNICKTYPIVGLRYRCLKCLSFDMCQRCFFEGRSSKSHKITHPMHEYCTATTAGDEMKDFTKALKNKFKSKRSLQKHTKKGYLPVQTVLEGDPLESPSPSPSHNVSSQDMHSRLELYASRLAEVELRTNSNSTPDSEDEHGLIAQYCQSLSSTDAPFPVPKSPLQIMASVDADQKDELEQMIKDLEEENRALQAEYERLKSEQPTGSLIEDGMGQRSEAEMLAEAKLLREHKGRLEARMSILEDHNRQLEAQLQRLRQLLVEQQSGMGSPNKSSTLQTKSVTASQLAMDSPAKINGHSNQGGPGSAYEGLDQMSEYVRPPPPPVGTIAHMGNLFSRAGDPERAAGSPVVMSRERANDSHNDVMNRERANDSQSDDDQSDENDYDNTVSPIQTKSD